MEIPKFQTTTEQADFRVQIKRNLRKANVSFQNDATIEELINLTIKNQTQNNSLKPI